MSCYIEHLVSTKSKNGVLRKWTLKFQSPIEINDKCGSKAARTHFNVKLKSFICLFVESLFMNRTNQPKTWKMKNENIFWLSASVSLELKRRRLRQQWSNVYVQRDFMYVLFTLKLKQTQFKCKSLFKTTLANVFVSSVR